MGGGVETGPAPDGQLVRRAPSAAVSHRLLSPPSATIDLELARSDQAHVPAEQSPSREDARVPPADAHPRRSVHSCRPPAQGSRSAVCLTADRPSSPRAAPRQPAAPFIGLPPRPEARSPLDVSNSDRPQRTGTSGRPRRFRCQSPSGRCRRSQSSEATASRGNPCPADPARRHRLVGHRRPGHAEGRDRQLRGSAGRSVRGPGGGGVTWLLVVVLKAYRRVISPIYGDVCRYYPSCSAYALEAVETHGAARGGWLAARRVCRCHPWAAGGVDPVPAVFQWRPDAGADETASPAPPAPREVLSP
jgi:uncharacterized protein